MAANRPTPRKKKKLKRNKGTREVAATKRRDGTGAKAASALKNVTSNSLHPPLRIPTSSEFAMLHAAVGLALSIRDRARSVTAATFSLSEDRVSRGIFDDMTVYDAAMKALHSRNLNVEFPTMQPAVSPSDLDGKMTLDILTVLVTRRLP